MRINRVGIGCAAGLMILSTYMALDTFVISNTYQNDATMRNMAIFESLAQARNDITEEAEDTSGNSGAANDGDRSSGNGTAGEQEETELNTSDATSLLKEYQDDEKSIRLYEYRVADTSVYVADVLLNSAADLKTAFANGAYGKNIKAATSEIAKENNAILAVNGDFYGARESGYVIRNGILYRDTPSGSEVLCIYADGHMEVVNDSEVTATELVENGVWQAFSFGPGLLKDGEITVSLTEEVGRAMASNPRTAIGVLDNNHFVFVVSDGRTGDDDGLSLYELADFMKSLGVKDAYNLDGGGSSTMVYDSELINTPTGGGKRSKERSVSDIVYIE